MLHFIKFSLHEPVKSQRLPEADDMMLLMSHCTIDHFPSPVHARYQLFPLPMGESWFNMNAWVARFRRNCVTSTSSARFELLHPLSQALSARWSSTKAAASSSRAFFPRSRSTRPTSTRNLPHLSPPDLT